MFLEEEKGFFEGETISLLISSLELNAPNRMKSVTVSQKSKEVQLHCTAQYCIVVVSYSHVCPDRKDWEGRVKR